MPREVRRRDLNRHLGLGDVRTAAGTAGGAGMASTVARLGAQTREAANSNANRASNVPVQTRYYVSSTIEEGDPYSLDLPTGHLWTVSVHGTWAGVTAGANGLFLGIIGFTSTALSLEPRPISAALHPDRPEQYAVFKTLGPCIVSAYARSTDALATPLSGSSFSAGIEAVWDRAAVDSDPS